MKLDEFPAVRVLAWFLAHPTAKPHFKRLCRELGLSPSAVKTYCGEFVGRGWLAEGRIAHLRIFSLDNDSYVVKALKKAYFLERLRKARMDALVDGAVSLALYGSHASGDYDEKSDVDMLVIGRKENVNYGEVERLEKALGRQLQITVVPLEKWERGKVREPFAASVLKNHVVLSGAEL